MKAPFGAQGKEEVFHFLETVLLEVLQLFPSSYIHIGGDEVRRVSPPRGNKRFCRAPGWCWVQEGGVRGARLMPQETLAEVRAVQGAEC